MLGWLRVSDEAVAGLERCRDCGCIVDTRRQDRLRRHRGHHLTNLRSLHVTEWLRVWLGLI